MSTSADTSVEQYKKALDIDRLKRARTAYAAGAAMTAEKFGPTPRHLAQSEKAKAKSEKAVQRKLNRLQNASPKLAAGLATGKKMAVAAFAGRLFMQIDLATDWLFILLASFALLKDIMDIAFAALGAVPVLGIAGAAVGIIFSFVGDLLFLILTVTVLVLVGSSLKNRGAAKYFLSTMMEFIAEALPAISWLPWTVVYVFILYIFVLYDRAYDSRYSSQGAEVSQT